MGAPRENQDSEQFISRVAWLYYENRMTQSEVADHLGVTRLRVNKAIASARDSGLVRIDLESPFAAAQELQTSLARRFSLREARVGLAKRTDHDPHRAVGSALAFYIDELLDRNNIKSIGVSWGRTLEVAISRMRQRRETEIEVISMIGGTAKGATFNAFGIAAGIAQKLNAEYSLFAAPIYYDTSEIAEEILGSPLFRRQLDKAREVDVALLVAGDLSERSFMIRDGLPMDVSTRSLVKAGAVGDLLGRFLDASGATIPHELNKRAIGLPLSDLHRLNQVVLAAAGSYKIPIIRAVLTAGYVDTLITDDVTAEELLLE